MKNSYFSEWDKLRWAQNRLKVAIIQELKIKQFINWLNRIFK